MLNLFPDLPADQLPVDLVTAPKNKIEPVPSPGEGEGYETEESSKFHLVNTVCALVPKAVHNNVQKITRLKINFFILIQLRML